MTLINYFRANKTRCHFNALKTKLHKYTFAGRQIELKKQTYTRLFRTKGQFCTSYNFAPSVIFCTRVIKQTLNKINRKKKLKDKLIKKDTD